MNILYIKDFSNVDDPIKTEETINFQLIREAAKIDTDYNFVSMPLAWNINKIGLLNTQKIINDVCSTHSGKKLFFVCQHILVNKLNFHGHLVFTPHATLLDSYIPIPHYSCNYDLDLVKPWNDREYEFSFMGSFKTHPVREKICNQLKNKNDCLFIDTGDWHFYGDEVKQRDNKKRYIELLGNTKYSLCPRGTGPSTIRMWEAMAMGSYPVIISDYLKMPLEIMVSNDLWFKAPENCDIIIDKDDEFNNDEYFQYFSNENLVKSIVYYL
jgi:hypothetical protein